MVSTVIVSYRCSDLVRDCVASCVREMEAGDEVILIENSGDRSLMALEQEGVTVEISEENLGFTRGVRAGLARARNPWRLVLNPDTQLEQGAGPALRAALRSASPRIHCIELLDASGVRQDYYRRFPTVRALAVMFFVPAAHQRRFRSYRRYTYADDLPARSSFEQPPGAGLILPAGTDLDSTYFLYGSDLQLCWEEVRRTGEEIPLLPVRCVHYRSSGGTGAAADRARLRADSALAFCAFFARTRPRRAAAWWGVFVVGSVVSALLRAPRAPKWEALSRFFGRKTYQIP
jgi:N-acetylglucosaminyl-diphospho-decaprenol L-rhamnosyltransferase